MYASLPSARPGLGAVPPPAAVVGGKLVCSSGAVYVIADDTGKRWNLRHRTGRPLRDSMLTGCAIARVKIDGTLLAPDTIGVLAWGRQAAGEQTFTTIGSSAGTGALERTSAPTDTIAANLQAIEETGESLFVGQNTRSLVEQAATWGEEEAATFAQLRDPATQALEEYLAEAGVEGEEAEEFVREGTPGREDWNPDVVPTHEEMWGHIAPPPAPVATEAGGFLGLDIPPWALWGGAGLLAVLMLRRGPA